MNSSKDNYCDIRACPSGNVKFFSIQFWWNYIELGILFIHLDFPQITSNFFVSIILITI